MSVSLEEILNLPIEERLELVASIWASIADGPELMELSAAERGMLDERLDDLDKNPDAGSPWPEVKARVFGKK
jgi:putative addiction module component (TIGR02574 family)